MGVTENLATTRGAAYTGTNRNIQYLHVLDVLGVLCNVTNKDTLKEPLPIKFKTNNKDAMGNDASRVFSNSTS